MELEQSIQALQAFEGDYRKRLRGAVESLLKELQDESSKEPSGLSGQPSLLLTTEPEEALAEDRAASADLRPPPPDSDGRDASSSR